MKFGDVANIIELGMCVDLKMFLVRLNDSLLQQVSDHFNVDSNFHNSLFGDKSKIFILSKIMHAYKDLPLD